MRTVFLARLALLGVAFLGLAPLADAMCGYFSRPIISDIKQPAVLQPSQIAFGGLGHLLTGHARLLTRILGVLTILLGLLFAGVFDRFSFAGRIVRPSARPKAGLAVTGVLSLILRAQRGRFL